MADYIVMKAVEFDKLPAKFKKQHGNVQALVDQGYFVQHKYDGCMGIAVIYPEGGSKMLSRTGEDYSLSCGHILSFLEGIAPGPTIFIGEVWQPIEEAPFPVISGKFRAARPSPELRFIVNDMLPIGFDTTTSYRSRYGYLCTILPDFSRLYTACVAHTDTGVRDVLGYALALQGQGGYDGAIVRNPDAGYTVGLVKNGEIVKVKPTLSLDLQCVQVMRNPGEKTGRDVFTLEVEYKGVRTVVGSGVPHQIGDLLGNIVEIECLGITADGKLREPRFKGLRFDKLKPD